jgi:hypothetical protein
MMQEAGANYLQFDNTPSPLKVSINISQLFSFKSVLSLYSLPLTIIFPHGEAIGLIAGVCALVRRHSFWGGFGENCYNHKSSNHVKSKNMCFSPTMATWSS